MRAHPAFQGQNKAFWAHVRSISEAQGYTRRGADAIKKLDAAGIVAAFRKLGLSSTHLVANGKLTELGTKLCEYFEYRANLLDNFVQPRLMDAARAERVYNELKAKLKPRLAATMNKQSGAMKKVAYLTGLVNMIVEDIVGSDGFNSDPRQLTTFTKDSMPLRTLSRRVDGAFPSVVNPIAIWEIKEYYYTTTFGSRVADGVYETLLDGMELEEMHEHEGRRVEHLLCLDARYTWWECGRSYLCRIVDMMNMNYVDEVLFGYEVVERLPVLVREWVAREKAEAGCAPRSCPPRAQRT
ncbi:hypothetical protein ACMHYJ_11295 [Castellaniella hirudinis]|uniref:Uncharacterized protein n=1 Tax=Castellaniella ginsengisoli TaxID=546114 RepID=A0AB39EXC2_9BURK